MGRFFILETGKTSSCIRGKDPPSPLRSQYLPYKWFVPFKWYHTPLEQNPKTCRSPSRCCSEKYKIKMVHAEHHAGDPYGKAITALQAILARDCMNDTRLASLNGFRIHFFPPYTLVGYFWSARQCSILCYSLSKAMCRIYIGIMVVGIICSPSTRR